MVRFFRLIGKYELGDVDVKQVYIVEQYETCAGGIRTDGYSFEEYFKNSRVLAVFEADGKLHVVAATPSNEVKVYVFEEV